MVLIIKEKIAAILATAVFLALCPGAEAQGLPEVSADCAVVMHSDGQVLFEKNSDKRALIASTTKLMTALVVLEEAELDETVEIGPEHCGIEGSTMYLREGESYTVRELLLGLLLVSGNDAAAALADHVSGSQKGFVRLMNRRARALDMRETRFANPHGLDQDGHYSTAGDMARLMCACMKNDRFREFAGTKGCTVKDQYLLNHNRLLGAYPGCIAGKTGYTSAAGRCLVTCCQRDGTELVCVTLSAPDDWNDHMRLYDWAYARYGTRDITSSLSFDVPVVSGSAETVTVAPAESISLFMPKSLEVEIRAELPQFVFAPVKIGETAGNIWVIIEGEQVAGCELIYTRDVKLATRCANNLAALEKL